MIFYSVTPTSSVKKSTTAQSGEAAGDGDQDVTRLAWESPLARLVGKFGFPLDWLPREERQALRKWCTEFHVDA